MIVAVNALLHPPSLDIADDVAERLRDHAEVVAQQYARAASTAESSHAEQWPCSRGGARTGCHTRALIVPLPRMGCVYPRAEAALRVWLDDDFLNLLEPVTGFDRIAGHDVFDQVLEELSVVGRLLAQLLVEPADSPHDRTSLHTTVLARDR